MATTYIHPTLPSSYVGVPFSRPLTGSAVQIAPWFAQNVKGQFNVALYDAAGAFALRLHADGSIFWSGKWAMLPYRTTDKLLPVVFFELTKEAMLFKLTWG